MEGVRVTERGEVEFLICCTDQGQHSRVRLSRLVLDGDEVREVLARRKASGYADGDVLHDGEGGTHAAPRKYLAPAESHLRMYEGEERWRWKCPRCGRDSPLSGENLRAWMSVVADTPDRELDISLLPT